jgi:signal transduction histidine kinase/CheY-like chemotaxis protein
VLLVLSFTAALPMALALVFQDRALSRDLESAAAIRLTRAADSARELIDGHLESLFQRYRAISGTPQLRAQLEIDDAATLAHFSEELRARQGAARIALVGTRGRTSAGAGDAALDPDALSVGRGLFARSGALYAAASVPLRTEGVELGRLVAVERVEPALLARWSLLCGAELRVGEAQVPTSERMETEVVPLGRGALWVGSSPAERDALARSRQNLLRAGGIALGAALLLSLLLASGLVDPIRELKNAAERIGHGELGARVSSTRGDEIGELSRALNEMARRLEEHDAEIQRTNTELLATNRELSEEKERALAASRAKSDFLANVSHEIRTPLTAILGYAELLLDRHGVSDTERDSIATIRRNGEHLLALLSDVLDVSRIEAGKLRLERRRCAPVAIVEEAIAMVRGRAEDKGLALEVELATELPARIETDAVRLRQILVNLLGNAVKFTERGGVRLSVRAEARPTPRLVFEIADSGIGIPAEYRRHLYEPFSQADTSSTRRFGGVGLGLSITRRLVEHLGGEIGCQSEAGRGTTFSFWIEAGPTRDGSVPEAPSGDAAARTAAAAAPLRSGRVLLAEDSADSQLLLSTILRRAGYAVEIAADGERAVADVLAAQAAGEPFAVVLMDMQMPALDGYEATARLRRAGYAGSIVALTAHAMTGDREKCIHAGCDDFATKPILREGLLELVARHVRKAQPAKA